MKDANMESLVFYRSYMEAAQQAELSEQDRCLFYEGIINYATFHQDPEFTNPVVKGLFVVCKANIDANILKYEQRKNAVEYGKKGGAPKGNKNAAKTKRTEEKSQRKAEGYGQKEKKENGHDNEEHALDNEENKRNEKISEDSENKQNLAEKATENATSYEEKETTEIEQKTTPETTLNENADDNDYENKNNNSNVSSFLEKSKKEKDIKEQRTLQQRNVDFYNSLLPYVKQYGREPLQEFYYYWAEPNIERTKLKFEMERTWLLEVRLDAWMRKRARLEGRKFNY